ncbi:MAG: glycosyltransferase family 4 protein [Azoarcus sp.]|nr:glycosyltransferase family 4 protein [Azoarcus sp.]
MDALKVIYPFVGDSVGGSHISTLTLIRTLDRRFFTPVIVLHQEGALAEFLQENGVKYEILPLPAYAGATPRLSDILRSAARAAATLRRFCHERDASLIHGNDLRINLTWGLSVWGTQYRFIWHQRSIPNSRSWLWKLVPKLADHVIFISSATRERMLGKKESPRHSIIMNPVSVNPLSPQQKKHARECLRESLGLEQDAWVFAFVARLVSLKKPETFIRVLARIQRESQHPVCGILAGHDQDGLRQELENLAFRLGIGESVRFLGFRSPIDSCIAGSDLLIAPSYWDAFGRTLVEAMLLETPVLASNAGGHREIIKEGKNGLFAEVDDVEEFCVKAIRIMMDKYTRENLAKTALLDAQQRFSAHSHAEAVSAIYRKVTGKKERREAWRE